MNDDRGTRDEELAGGDGHGHPARVGGLSAGPEDERAEPAAPPASGNAPVPGSATAGGAGGRRQATRSKGRSWWIELPILLAFALILALLIKTFVVQAFFIPSSSMENTLDIGDKVLVNKMVYDFRPIHRGDVVVFNGDGSWNAVPVQAAPPLTRLWNAISGLLGTAPGVHDYIKRVIGVPGDHVACCDSQGRITVNGVSLTEKSYLYPGNAPSTQSFSITVPRGRLWVMGDHRSVSYDSRGHMSDPGNGTIPEDHVVGRAFVIVAPVSRWRVLSIPATFDQPKLTASAAGLVAAPGQAGPAARAGFAALSAVTSPAVPGAALAITGALPLTWLQRRVRRRLLRSGSRRRGTRRPGRR